MSLWQNISLVIVFLGLVVAGFQVPEDGARKKSNYTFTIDYERNTFLKDGKPFRYISGSIHYFRIHPHAWEDRLKKIRAAGFNAIQIYVEWSSHEPSPWNYDFHGGEDLEHFLSLAQKWGLLVILRPGPFIDAERDMGGLPFWLLQKNKHMKLRTRDPSFMKAVEHWFRALFVRLKKHLYQNGGTIIMVQVENEYGSYGQQTGNCDLEYLSQLRDITRKYLGQDVLLFSTDGGGSIQSIRCAKIPGVYATVDFGPNENFRDNFHHQRLFEPKGPLVNSEFYTGWLDHWGYRHSKVRSEAVSSILDKMLQSGANVNMYMIHGGTSFAFTAGSNDPPFQVTPTSYDYDAPITEAGDLTQKYWELKRIIGKYNPIPKIHVHNGSKEAYGDILLRPLGNVFRLLPQLQTLRILSPMPKTFEDLGQAFGFVLYEHRLDHMTPDPVQLEIRGLHDRGYVFVDEDFRGILSRIDSISSMPLSIKQGQVLGIVVENQGRVCFGKGINDFKGITSEVKLGRQVLSDWIMHSIPLSNVSALESLPSVPEASHNSMTFWKGHMHIPCPTQKPSDTFLSFRRWSKGVAFVNGFNLGRYWPRMGPQASLYVPGPVLKCGNNSVIVLEQDQPACQYWGSSMSCGIESSDTPQIDSPTPY